MRSRTRPALVAAMAVIGLVATGCGQADPGGAGGAGPTHPVTDSSGATVTVPDQVHRVADAWPAHNEVVQMLGAGDGIVGTVLTPQQTPWLYTVTPALRSAPTLFTKTTVDTERLAAARPDVVFTPTNPQLAAKTTELGIPTVQLSFQSYDEMKRVVDTTAQVLGGGAPQQARAYDDYLDATLAEVSGRTAGLPVERRPRVLHVNSLDPLVIDGTNSIIDRWITAAGGRNAAGVAGNLRPVSAEQVASWNPDVIILGSNAGPKGATAAQTLDRLRDDPFWAGLAAVRDQHTYVNPTGAFLWDRYGVEAALQLPWAGKLLHPELFADVDMVARTREFYDRFLHYRLTPEQARRILAAQKPA